MLTTGVFTLSRWPLSAPPRTRKLAKGVPDGRGAAGTPCTVSLSLTLSPLVGGTGGGGAAEGALAGRPRVWVSGGPGGGGAPGAGGGGAGSAQERELSLPHLESAGLS